MSVLFPKKYNIVRFTGADIDGDWVETRSPEIEILADAQPITGRELETLNIGRENIGKIRIFTDEILDVSLEGSGTNSTYFDYGGCNWYEIIQENSYQGGLINHNSYIAELRVNIEERMKLPCQ